MENKSSLVVFNRTFDEANTLLLEAREYVKFYAVRDIHHLSSIDKLRISCEAMRVTARLTQIMGWLLIQKAIRTGDMSREDYLKEEGCFLTGGTCLDTTSQEDPETPPRLRSLLERSYQLYLRVQRLDEKLRKNEDILKSPSKRPEIHVLKVVE